MTSRRRGAQASGFDDAAPVAQSLFPDEPSDEPSPESPEALANSSGWTPPPARAYLAPELAPDPMRPTGALDDPDLPYWLALTYFPSWGKADAE